ncbi:hypothetical protein [Phenylobacterium sp. Root700]|uniref:hypothetical protein n=1 Tax=Phenylobacterium sp. Root700 TaxID=1736591 RepID=UPI0006F3777F|nr:hypothetical protein [Phenylobacterium sp. Root700]KRB39978.1 hypothetical protein ASE02_09280 [Phenylobacterium sp. Root700]
MTQRLKVFVTSDGLTDYVVATSSKAKALSAWGAHQDLFKTGGAHESDDPALVAMTAASPGVVLRRPADSKAALATAPKRAKPKGPSKAALQKVARLEQELAVEIAGYDAERTRIDAAQVELDARRSGLEDGFMKRRAKLQIALRAARAALG